MSVWSAFRDGWRRTLRAPWLTAGLWLLTLMLALPAALVLRSMLADHLDASLAAVQAAAGVNFDWWHEFLAQAAGLGQTFVPAVLGFAAVIKNLSAIADAERLPGVIGGIVAAYILLTIFLTGGVLDRLARGQTVTSAAFFGACGASFARLLRLGVMAGLTYWWMFASLHPWLFDGLYPWLTQDLTVERTAFAIRGLLYLLFAAALFVANLIFDYAKIRMVIEDRHSAIGALSAAVRFIRNQPGAAVGLYLLNTLTFTLVVALYFLVVPGAGGGITALLALAVGQLFVVSRILARLAFAASQIAIFQGRLAHAGYVARPQQRWPDSIW